MEIIWILSKYWINNKLKTKQKTSESFLVIRFILSLLSIQCFDSELHVLKDSTLHVLLEKNISLILGLNTSLLTTMDRTYIILYYSTLFFRQTTAVIGKNEPENKNGFFEPWKLDQFLPFSQTWLRMHRIVQKWVEILSKGVLLGSGKCHLPIICFI